MTEATDFHLPAKNASDDASGRSWRAHAKSLFDGAIPIWTLRLPSGAPLEVGVGMPIIACSLFLLFLLLGAPLEGVAFSVAYITALLLHEFGHALGGRLVGSTLIKIRVGGLSGFCLTSRIENRGSLLVFAVMGPLANLAMAMAAGLLWVVLQMPDEAGKAVLPTQSPLLLHVTTTVAILNAIMFFGNILPVRPLDGGAILHLLLGALLEPRLTNRLCGAIGLLVATAAIATMLAVVMEYRLLLPLIAPFRPSWHMLRTGDLTILQLPSVRPAST